MDWIKIESATPNKPEIFRISKILGITRDDAIGKVVRFWIWLDTICVDGVVDGVVDADVDGVVDAVVGHIGFSSAMKSVGWLNGGKDKNGLNQGMRIPNFTRHNGESSKKRVLANKRQQKWRRNVDADVDGVVDGDVDADASLDKIREDKIREDKIREDKIREDKIREDKDLNILSGNEKKIPDDIREIQQDLKTEALSLKKSKGKDEPAPEDYKAIVDFLNLELKANYRVGSAKTRALIHARWMEGFRIPDFEEVIRKKKRAWIFDSEMVKFLRPETLFGPKFESYLNEIKSFGLSKTGAKAAETILQIREEYGHE